MTLDLIQLALDVDGRCHFVVDVASFVAFRGEVLVIIVEIFDCRVVSRCLELLNGDTVIKEQTA